MTANWKDPNMCKMFIELCVKECSEKGYSGASLKKESWDSMRATFREKKGVDFNKKQLKNQWEYLKKKYIAWAKLISKTGNVYNSVTNTITMSSEEWDEYIKANQNANQFRYKGLQYHEELSKIFNGLTATGKTTWSPAMQGLPTDELRSSSQIPIDLESEFIDTLVPVVEPKEDLIPAVKRRMRGKDEDLNGCLVKVLKTLEESDGPNIEECNKILDETLEVTDMLYIVACSIFCHGKAYKEQWMMLSQKSKEVRKQWIELNSKKMGYL